jgi:zinc transporter ZupT
MELGPLLLVTFLAALATDLATGLGAVPFFLVGSLSDRVKALFMGAAAGMMTTASVLQLLGAATELAPRWDIWKVGLGVALGGLFLWTTSRWLEDQDHLDIGKLRETGGRTALLIVATMTLHSLPEGIAIGVAYGEAAATGSTALGLSVALALAVHNIPEGVAITVALRGRGISTWKCMGWAVISSVPQPIFAPVSAGAVWLFAPLLPVGLGFAAGAMMYLVVAELLPEAYPQAGREGTAAAFTMGLLIMLVLNGFLLVG